MGPFMKSSKIDFAVNTANAVSDASFKLQAISENIVSSRDSLFTTWFWKVLMVVASVFRQRHYQICFLMQMRPPKL